jgi:hypothetical protein
MPRRPLIRVRTYRVSPSAWRAERPVVEGHLATPQSRRDPAYYVRLRNQRPRFPEVKSQTGLCKPRREGKKEPRCFVRLRFVGTDGAEKFGVKPGAYLIACNGSKKPGYPPLAWIPVRDAAHALEVSKSFCACRNRGKSTTACARKIGGEVKRRPKRGKRRR